MNQSMWLGSQASTALLSDTIRDRVLSCTSIDGGGTWLSPSDKRSHGNHIFTTCDVLVKVELQIHCQIISWEQDYRCQSSVKSFMTELLAFPNFLIWIVEPPCPSCQVDQIVFCESDVVIVRCVEIKRTGSEIWEMPESGSWCIRQESWCCSSIDPETRGWLTGRWWWRSVTDERKIILCFDDLDCHSTLRRWRKVVSYYTSRITNDQSRYIDGNCREHERNSASNDQWKVDQLTFRWTWLIVLNSLAIEGCNSLSRLNLSNRPYNITPSDHSAAGVGKLFCGCRYVCNVLIVYIQ